MKRGTHRRKYGAALGIGLIFGKASPSRRRRIASVARSNRHGDRAARLFSLRPWRALS